MLFVVALGMALAADDPATSETTFKTETPSGAPSGFNFAGIMFIGFLLGFVGLAGSIAGTYFFIMPLVATHRVERDVNDFDHINELG
jgi:hypothetical protein